MLDVSVLAAQDIAGRDLYSATGLDGEVIPVTPLDYIAEAIVSINANKPGAVRQSDWALVSTSVGRLGTYLEVL